MKAESTIPHIVSPKTTFSSLVQMNILQGLQTSALRSRSRTQHVIVGVKTEPSKHFQVFCSQNIPKMEYRHTFMHSHHDFFFVGCFFLKGFHIYNLNGSMMQWNFSWWLPKSLYSKVFDILGFCVEDTLVPSHQMRMNVVSELNYKLLQQSA